VGEYYVPALRMLGWQGEAVIVDPAGYAVEGARRACPDVAVRQADFRRALDDPSIGRAAGTAEAAVVALPNSLHEDATRLALQRGLHVLCEKPLALNSDVCRQLAGAAGAARRVLAVGMVRRLLPSLSVLAEGVRQGLIGEPVAIEVEDGGPYAWLSESGAFFRPENGGVLADMGVHYLDFVEELAGPLVPVSYADDWRGGVEAEAIFRLQTRAGVPVTLVLSRTRRLRDTVRVRGQRGELLAEKARFDGCLWRTSVAGTAVRLAPAAPFGRTDWPPTLHACFARQLADFGACIRGDSAGLEPRSPRPLCVTAERAASTIGLIEWAYSRRARGGVGPSGAAPDGAPATVPEGTIFVTGGTGFVGSHLVRRLFRRPTGRVVAPVRHYRTCAEIARFPVALPRLDLLDYRAVEAAMTGARFVFHLAYGRDGPRPERVTEQGTKNVVEAAIAVGCEAVVVLSTIYVFGRPAGVVDESWPYRPIGGGYGRSKARMERWCLQRARSSPRTRVVVLSPSCVYGPGGDVYTALPVRLADEGAFCWIEQGRGTANYTYVENLVDAMLLGAISAAAHGERFIINDGHTTWRTFLGELLGDRAAGLPSYTRRQLRHLHRIRPRPSLLAAAQQVAADPRLRAALRETGPVRAALRVADRIAPAWRSRLRPAGPGGLWSAPPPALGGVPPPEWLADLFGPARTEFAAEKARERLGWTPRVGLQQGMKATRAWLHSGDLD
jgi:nucleoside-diphosphate-sugar epimerase/predicted dehydrogenase